MIRLTVLYNLAPGVDEEEFLRWRLGDHQQENLSQPGVLHTDFTIVQTAWPEGTALPYRFMTTADWPTMEAFRAAFYDPAYQEELRGNLRKLADPLFLIGEIAASS